MGLYEVRIKYGLSQAMAASKLKVPLRTYVRYEKDNCYGNDMKRAMMIKTLHDEYEITERKGLLSIEGIQKALFQLFEEEYKGRINFCYVFGSYSKGYAKEDSDVDLCVDTDLAGLDFVGLSESIRRVLHKKIDLIRFSNLRNNIEFIKEIMKDGIKIYG